MPSAQHPSSLSSSIHIISIHFISILHLPFSVLRSLSRFGHELPELPNPSWRPSWTPGRIALIPPAPCRNLGALKSTEVASKSSFNSNISNFNEKSYTYIGPELYMSCLFLIWFCINCYLCYLHREAPKSASRQRPKRMPLRRGAHSSVFVCVHMCVYNYIKVHNCAYTYPTYPYIPYVYGIIIHAAMLPYGIIIALISLILWWWRLVIYSRV